MKNPSFFVKFVIIFVSVFFALVFFRTVFPIGLLVVSILFISAIIRYVRKRNYFSSDEFYAYCLKFKMLVHEHNDIENYANSLVSTDFFQLSVENVNRSSFSTFENTSTYAYNRSKHVDSVGDNVCNCSLQVVRNASRHPFKYLCKYFGVPMNEPSLERVEDLSNRLSKLENAVSNLHDRETEIFNSLNPPKFILKYYKKELDDRIGLKLSDISITYPKYVFEYVSAGGNSSQRAVIVLNGDSLDELASVMASRIRSRKTISGQRALMTSQLRQRIKERDHYTCQCCGLSIKDEPHLLLEVDHIIPLSKGGTTELTNLQTLCWRCNRKKSNKIL